MRKTIIAFSVLLFLGFVFGVFQSNFSGRVEKDKQTLWRTPNTLITFSQAADTLEKSLKQSGHFGFIPTVLVEAPPEPETPTIIPFPLILATALLDGVMHVSLKADDGTISSARAGDVITGDWKIQTVSMEAVTAENNGSVSQFVIYPLPSVDNTINANTP